ncbi:cytoplasmic protein [Peniophora sp. CONT]|nr:cytoplasmic protein [Peniophora sp. CONT]
MDANPSPHLFPPLRRADVLAFQFSSWYPVFSSLSIKSTVIRPVPDGFHAYLNADGVFLPEGSDDVPAKSSIVDVDDEDSSSEEDEEDSANHSFPELDEQIRAAVREYEAVFPKLNFSSPKDASWLLPSSSPLKCITPADVYMLLKSSDFITHDLDEGNVFAGCSEDDPLDGHSDKYELELVLRKWYPVERTRELRCFVRDGALLGITQRDDNPYDWLNEPDTQTQLARNVMEYWAKKIAPRWRGPRSYVLDVLLTRDLSRFHVLDFAPYAPRTDALLFTYEDLHALHLRTQEASDALPEFRVIGMDAKPAATPANVHNMVPLEALSLSAGRGIDDFQRVWAEQVRKGMQDSDSDSNSNTEGPQE